MNWIILIFIFQYSSFGFSQTVTFEKSWTIPAQKKIGKHRVGGLSGCVKVGSAIYFISDDRGGEGGARIISIPWDEQKKELQVLKPQATFLQNNDIKKIYDMEGIGFFQDQFLLSNEGDLNKKPRQNPELVWFTKSGQRKNAIMLPKEYLANPTGKQILGVQNNLGFEGLVIDSEMARWSILLEGPKIINSGKTDDALDILEGQLSQKSATLSFWKYPLPSYESTEMSALMMGATEILYLPDGDYLILERGLQLQLSGLDYRTQLCLGKKIKDTPVLNRQCIYQFESDKSLLKNIQKTGNFEGLCWMNEKKSQFLVVSDNNFSKTENTLFLLYNLN